MKKTRYGKSRNAIEEGKIMPGVLGEWLWLSTGWITVRTSVRGLGTQETVTFVHGGRIMARTKAEGVGIEEEETDSRGSRIHGRRWIITWEGRGRHFEGDHGEGIGLMGASFGAGWDGENCETCGDKHLIESWLNWCETQWGTVLGKILIPSAAWWIE